MDTAMDVLPNLFGFVPAQTQCGTCYAVILLTDAVIMNFMIGDLKVGEDHFCSTACATHSDYFKADNE